MSTQQTVWGNIEWLEPENPVDNVYSRVGIESVEGHSYQRPHIHYDEQILQVLSGYGRHWISDKCYALRPGRIFHIPTGATHELINDAQEPLRYMFTSMVPPQINPRENTSVFAGPTLPATQDMQDFESDPLSVAVSNLKSSLTGSNPFPFTIYDATGHPIHLAEYYPLTCRLECESLIKTRTCPCMSQIDNDTFHYDCTFACPYGIRIFSVPIFFDSKYLGYVHGGYLRNVDSSHVNLPGSFPIQKNTQDSVFAFLRGISNCISDYCHVAAFQFSLEKSKIREELAQERLRKKEFELSNLKINYHFLFNTMNGMAAMALEGQNIPLYRSIIQLSNLFQYTLRAKSETTTLQKEFDYVRSYLELQKLRHRNKLDFRFEIADGIQLAVVPTNFLQPLVENAFTHGFNRLEQKNLVIRAYHIDKRITIHIINNGRTLTNREYAEVNERFKKNYSRGMGMVYEKLTMLYNEDFSANLSAASPDGSILELNIPFRREKDD